MTGEEDENLAFDDFNIGDLVEGDFDNNFVCTFSMASESQQGTFQGDGPQFYKDEIGLIIDLVSTPESIYSIGFCKLLLASGKTGWLPNSWLVKVGHDTK